MNEPDRPIAEILRSDRDIAGHLIDAAPIIVLLLSPDGEIQFVNRHFTDLTGYGLDEIRGKDWFALFIPERDRRRIRDLFEVAMGGEPTRGNVNPILTRSGDEIQVSWSDALIRGSDGGIVSLMAVGTDVTKTQEVEEALRASQIRLALAQAMAEIGSWELDLTSGELSWSDEIYHMFELPPGEFVPTYEKFLSYVHPDDRATVDRAYRESVSSHEPYQIEHRILMPDGRVKYVEERCQTWYDDNGKPIRSVGTVQNITRRRLAQQEAARKSAILDTALETMPQGFAIFDSSQKIVAHNRKYIELAGLPAGCQPLNMSHEEVLRLRAKEGKTVEPLTEDVIQRRVRRLKNQESTVERVRPDGTAFIYHRSPLPDGGYVVTYTDVTEIKRAEEHLRQSQKMQAIGQLTGGIAHDFNNLLAVIQGNADLLLDKLGPDDQAANAIIRASERGAELTQRLLAFSRQQPLFPSVVDTKDLVREMANLLQRTLGETIEITFTAPGNLWPIKVDRNQIENSILNLGINAKDAMPEGGKLSFRCANLRLDEAAAGRLDEMEPGEYVKITVRDTGIGMSKEVLARAFEPFFTTKDIGRGTGLGLSMVYGFAKQSGGHATIESEEGAGTAVTLYLPRAEGQAVAESAPASSETPLGEQEPVLVIEDNPAVCSVMEEILLALKYDVKTAYDFATAEAILQREPIRVVISDVVLSGSQRGPEFAEKAIRRYPDLKFIFMSGYPTDLANAGPALSGNEVLLKKPFGRHELALVVRKALGK